jgi:hypothetical protein
MTNLNLSFPNRFDKEQDALQEVDFTRRKVILIVAKFIIKKEGGWASKKNL